MWVGYLQDSDDGGGILVGHCPLCGATLVLRRAKFGQHVGNEFWGCSRYPECKGSLNLDGSAPVSGLDAGRVAKPKKVALTPTPKRSVSAAPQSVGKRPTRLRKGDLLVSETNTLGPGKLVAADGENLVLEYFDFPNQPEFDRERRSVPRHGLRRFSLRKETRVFWLSGGKWRSGRVDEVNDLGDIYVRGHEWENYIPEERIFVRWTRPLSDPVGFAAGGLLESPLLADLRRPFLQSILRQRSAARGMKAALSSAIELHDHQIETAWRVLQDPVQRYLLADEVGLGKTIEAGVILRQLLIQIPRLSVLIILPPFLIGQWQQELATKFFIQDFPYATINFARDDEPETWSPADLLIVDEAHNLASLADSKKPELAARYSKLAATAKQSPRLLMLSATPALNNEPVFLQMLRLLDPAVYDQVSVEQLRRRLMARSGLGRIFLGLQPHLPAMLLRNRLAELRIELAGDTDAESLLDAASLALTTSDQDIIRESIDNIRLHVAEVHRVHRRMLRTRRTVALQAAYQVTGRRRPLTLKLDSPVLTETTRLLEAWRQQALAACENEPVALRSAVQAFADAVNLAFDPSSLAAWARSRNALSSPEQSALDSIVEDLSYLNRRKVVSRPIADALSYLFTTNEKVVIFCPTAAVVTELARELRTFLPETEVLEHRMTDSLAHIESVVQQFETSEEGAVLIADSSAEEGRNFQFADLLVHVGVPSDANRMEQRIGRCDRWKMDNKTSVWRSIRVTDDDKFATFTSAWTRILDEGFGVFDSSIASLQFAVETTMEDAWSVLFREGLEATDAIIGSVRSALETEVERVREQDALDSIETNDDHNAVNGKLSDFESRELDFAEIAHALLAGAPGNLRFHTSKDPVHGVGGYDAFTRLPDQQLLIPLIPLERLERDFLPTRAQQGTYVRREAIRHRGTHLYRYGDPFIDAICDFLRNDDRGRAFGMWRWRPKWGYGEQVAYRFDYAVEAHPSEGDVALQHRADNLFPPAIVTVWIDGMGNPVTDPLLLGVLNEPYAKPTSSSIGGDYALNRTRIEEAYRYVPAAQWSRRWRLAEASAENYVRDIPEMKNAIVGGVQRTKADSAKRISQIKLRAARVTGEERSALKAEEALEEAAQGALTSAMQNPMLRLDGTGIAIVSGEQLVQRDNK